MRLWSLHPKYLDSQGLVGVWREALLAKAVLSNQTRGYTNHPQLNRFKNYSQPLLGINFYLQKLWEEANTRGYNFNKTKFNHIPTKPKNLIPVTTKQIAYEAHHLLKKLQQRQPQIADKWCKILNSSVIQSHPLFIIKNGPIEDWEKVD